MTKQLSPVKDLRRRSRDHVGQVPKTRIIPDKRKKPAKHKPDYKDTDEKI